MSRFYIQRGRAGRLEPINMPTSVAPPTRGSRVVVAGGAYVQLRGVVRVHCRKKGIEVGDLPMNRQEGVEGYVCKVQLDDGRSVWIDAEQLRVIKGKRRV